MAHLVFLRGITNGQQIAVIKKKKPGTCAPGFFTNSRTD